MTFLKYAVFFFFLVIGNMTNAQIISSESSTAEPIDWSKPKEYTLGPIEVEAKETDKNVIRLLSGLTSGDKIQIPGDKMSEAIKTG